MADNINQDETNKEKDNITDTSECSGPTEVKDTISKEDKETKLEEKSSEMASIDQEEPHSPQDPVNILHLSSESTLEQQIDDDGLSIIPPSPKYCPLVPYLSSSPQELMEVDECVTLTQSEKDDLESKGDNSEEKEEEESVKMIETFLASESLEPQTNIVTSKTNPAQRKITFSDDTVDQSADVTSEKEEQSECEPCSPPKKRRLLDESVVNNDNVHIEDDHLNSESFKLSESNDLKESNKDILIDNDLVKEADMTEQQQQNSPKDHNLETELSEQNSEQPVHRNDDRNDWCLHLSVATQPLDGLESEVSHEEDLEVDTHEPDQNVVEPKENVKSDSDKMENLTKSDDSLKKKNLTKKSDDSDKKVNLNNSDNSDKNVINSDDLDKREDPSVPLFQIKKPSSIQEIPSSVAAKEDTTVFTHVRKLKLSNAASESKEKCIDVSLERSSTGQVSNQSDDSKEVSLPDIVSEPPKDEMKSKICTVSQQTDSVEEISDKNDMSIPVVSKTIRVRKTPIPFTETKISPSKETQTESTDEEASKTTNYLADGKLRKGSTSNRKKSSVIKPSHNLTSEFGMQVDSLCLRCNCKQNLSSSSNEVKHGGDSRKKMITVVRHTTQRQIIVDGKVTKSIVVEEEDDPIIEYIEDSDMPPPLIPSSLPRTSTCISRSSLTSGELADISSSHNTLKSTSSSGSASNLFTLPLHSAVKRTSSERSMLQMDSNNIQDLSSDTDLFPSIKPSNSISPGNKSQSKPSVSYSCLKNTSRACSPEISPPEIVNSNISRSVLPGVRVMAKWKDGYYYPGTVSAQISEARWAILFDDGGSIPIWEKDIIVCSMLRVGQTVYALSDDGCYDPGIIKDYYKQGKELGYMIERDYNELKKYPQSSVTLSSEQAYELINAGSEAVPSPFGINQDNIIEGKRRPSPKVSICEDKQKSRTPVSSNKSASLEKLKTIESGNTESNLKGSSTKKSRRITNRSDSDSKQEICQKLRSTRCKRTLYSPSDTSEEKPDDTLAGNQQSPNVKSPRIQKAERCALSKLTAEKGDKRLFVGFAFLLTLGDKTVDKSQYVTSDSCAEIGEVEAKTETYDKSAVQVKIEAKGGTVLNSIEDIQTVKANHIYLLSNTYLRTIKYIYCLAAGIPCISHLWIQECCRFKKIQSLQPYLLPAGFNITDKCEIEWHGKKSVLKDMHILVVSAKQDFVDTWSPILMASEAEVIYRIPPQRSISGSFAMDVVLSDHSCPQSIIRRANQMKIPVVSTEWVVQCFITGCQLPTNINPRFKYNFEA